MRVTAFQLHPEAPVKYEIFCFNQKQLPLYQTVHTITYLAKASVKIFDILTYKTGQLKASLNLTGLHFFTALQTLIASDKRTIVKDYCPHVYQN